MPFTPNRANPYPLDSEPDDVPADVQELAIALDNVADIYYGTLAQRPVSTAPSPGRKWRLYWATDTTMLSLDTGTSWVDIGPSVIADNAVTTAKLLALSVTTAKIADANVTLAKMAANSVDSSKIVDGSIVAADLAADAADTTRLKNLAVTTGKLADGAVTAVKMANDAFVVPTVTSLPTTPYQGQTVDFVADTTKGTVWRFKYRGGQAYPWELVGGTPLVINSTALATPASTTFGGSFTMRDTGYRVPFAGDWIVGAAQYIGPTAPAGTVSMYVSLVAVGTDVASQAGGTLYSAPPNGQTYTIGSVPRLLEGVLAPTGTNNMVQVGITSPGYGPTANWSVRDVTVLPRRVA